MFSELNDPARQPSVYASLCSLAKSQARLEASMESLLLFRRALSSPTMCRFIPALSVLNLHDASISSGVHPSGPFSSVPFSSSTKGKLAKTRLFRNGRISVMPEPPKQRVESRLAAEDGNGRRR